MTYKQYLADRLFFLCTYVLSIFILLFVVELDLWIHNKELEWSTLLYGVSLSVGFLLVLFIQDYHKRKKFATQIERYLSSGAMLSDSLFIDTANTNEQELIVEAMTMMRQQYLNSIQEQLMKQKQQTIFLNQWIHQMKTPVSVIELLLQKEELPTRVRDSIREENQRLLQGLDLALHMARLEQFEKDYKVEEVDMIDLVRTLINQQRKTFIQYAVYPKMEIQTEKFIVATDKKWLTIALQQVIINALKYTKITEQSTKQIVVKLSEHERFLELEVSDTGIGIPIQDQKRVFEPFFTGNNGRKTREATGMGLYITKEICDRLGHSVHLESTEGSGTSVSFRFAKDEAYHHMMKQDDKTVR
ncbi:sensor histidine kinase [Microbacteriaceae bacterium 4G12]